MSDLTDRDLYGLLHSSRERLCVAQTIVPDWWKPNLQRAIDQIDIVGSATCAAQWSRFDQPEYGGE